MKGVEEPTGAAMKAKRDAEIAVHLKKVTTVKATTKAGDNNPYNDFAERKSKDQIDDN